MKTKKNIAMILAFVMIIASLTACSKDESKSSNGDAAAEQVLNLSTNSVVVGLNPIQNTTAPDNGAHNLICEPLVRNRTAENNMSEIVPGAAASWEISEDGLTYTFNMQENAKWNDGEPFTAKDFEYTLRLMADPEVASTNAWLFDGIIEGFGEALYENKSPEDISVKALDDKTLEIKLVHPASYFLELISSLYPVRQDKYEELGKEYGTAADKIICSGPFEVTNWSQNTEMNLKKNENYWNVENVSLDKINYKVIQEAATAVQAFINGEIDLVYTTDPNWQQTIEATGMAVVQTVPDNAPEFLMFNLNNEYLSNTKIRQALSAAFDRQKFVDDLRDGQAFPIYSTMPDTMLIGDKSYTELVDGKNYFVKDLQKENPNPKELLIEGLKELGKDEDPSKVTIRYASRGTAEFSKKMAEWYKQVWEESLGITVQIDMMEWNIMWDRIDAGDYDIAVGGWGPYYNEPSAILTLFDPVNGYFNTSKIGWDDENSQRFKELCDMAVNVVDPKEKANIYLEAEELLVKNAIIAPEYLGSRQCYLAKYVKGWHESTIGSIDYSQISIEK